VSIFATPCLRLVSYYRPIRALGVADGKAHEGLWKLVQDEPFNKTDVLKLQLISLLQASFKPILERGQRLAVYATLQAP
jgi:hypothetical protein